MPSFPFLFMQIRRGIDTEAFHANNTRLGFDSLQYYDIRGEQRRQKVDSGSTFNGYRVNAQRLKLGKPIFPIHMRFNSLGVYMGRTVNGPQKCA